MTTDTIDAAADGSRLLLQTLRTASRPKPQGAIKEAWDTMLNELKSIDPPSIPRDVQPYDLERVGIHLLTELAPIVDSYIRVCGQELDRNSSCRVDLRCFVDQLGTALEGNADYEARRCSDVLADEIIGDMR